MSPAKCQGFFTPQYVNQQVEVVIYIVYSEIYIYDGKICLASKWTLETKLSCLNFMRDGLAFHWSQGSTISYLCFKRDGRCSDPKSNFNWHLWIFDIWREDMWLQHYLRRHTYVWKHRAWWSWSLRGKDLKWFTVYPMKYAHILWWRHQMETFSLLLAQWRGTLIFSLICAWINGWINNREAGDLRRHRHHYDVIVMAGLCCVLLWLCCSSYWMYVIGLGFSLVGPFNMD